MLQLPDDPEIWRQHPYFIWYQVSTHGRCRRYWNTPSAISIMKQTMTKNGYYRIQLTAPDRHRESHFVHRLVLETFDRPQPTPWSQCSHWDGDRGNNRLSNLAWAYPEANAAQKLGHGTHGNKLSTEDARAIRYGRLGVPVATVAAEFGVTVGTVRSIQAERTWKGLGRNWPPPPKTSPSISANHSI
jgi:hypothetical protein